MKKQEKRVIIYMVLRRMMQNHVIFVEKEKMRNFFEKRLDNLFQVCYNNKVASTERWLSWSKAHDWKSC